MRSHSHRRVSASRQERHAAFLLAPWLQLHLRIVVRIVLELLLTTNQAAIVSGAETTTAEETNVLTTSILSHVLSWKWEGWKGDRGGRGGRAALPPAARLMVDCFYDYCAMYVAIVAFA